MKENILKIIVSNLFFFLFFPAMISSQGTKIEMVENTILYTQKNNYNPVTVSYTVKNTSKETVYFVLNQNSFGLFSEPGLYNFGYKTSNIYRLDEEEKIFNARLFILDNKLDTLTLDWVKSPSNYKLEEYSRLVQIQENIDNDSIKKLNLYKDKYFSSKSINWVARAKYINDNIKFLKPNESLLISTPIDFKLYYYDTIFDQGTGYYLTEKSYNIILKIHNNSSLVLDYLDKRNKKKVKKTKALPLLNNLFSNKITLTVRD